MADDKRKILFDAVSKDFDVGTFDEFNKKLDDPAKQKALYDAVGVKYDLGTFDEFSNKVKKKRYFTTTIRRLFHWRPLTVFGKSCHFKYPKITIEWREW